MPGSCHVPPIPGQHQEHHPVAPKRSFDTLLWGSLACIAFGYLLFALHPGFAASNASLLVFSRSMYELMNTMAWGILLGIAFVGLLSVIPEHMVFHLLGRGGTLGGVFRATLAGVLLDLCSHGILMVGAQLYKKGASLGQTMAFLIASPWNSLSLTFILWALIGFWWTLLFLLCSMVIGIVSGLFFDFLVARKVLSENPYLSISVSQEASKEVSVASLFRLIGSVLSHPVRMLSAGLSESRMVLRWIFFGVVLAGLVRVVISPSHFETFFGPTLMGLGLTVLIATLLEVCSEGSTPIAADLLTRARAPGNSFAFLMTGVSTDYTEIMVLKEATRSWKTSLFLPLVSVPQVLLIAWLMNHFSVSSFP